MRAKAGKSGHLRAPADELFIRRRFVALLYSHRKASVQASQASGAVQAIAREPVSEFHFRVTGLS
jgi:hypothetical protein